MRDRKLGSKITYAPKESKITEATGTHAQTEVYSNLNYNSNRNTKVYERKPPIKQFESKCVIDATRDTNIQRRSGSNGFGVCSGSRSKDTSQIIQDSNEPGAIILAPKKKPANRAGLEKVGLLTNFWELHVSSKITYRYDVSIHLSSPTNPKAVDLLRGERDDSSMIARRALCLKLLNYALEYYRIFNEGAAYVYDGASIMFSSEDLTYALKEHSGVLSLDVSDLPDQIRDLILRVDVNTVTLEISPCRDAASSFDIADLSAQKNRNWATLDRSWKQFYELLTSQDALTSGRFTQFGAGSLYLGVVVSENIGYGYRLFSGVHKGIKFIEGKRTNTNGADDIIAALVLDHRVGIFFNNQNLMQSIRELDGLQNLQQFDFSCDHKNFMNSIWTMVNNHVKGVRMQYICSNTNPLSFTAVGISKKPIKELKDILPNKERTEISIMAKFSYTNIPINPYWPAVIARIRRNVQYFPMELLEVAPNQRVSLEKQFIVERRLAVDNPTIRFNKIRDMLEALNLHDSGLKNKFLQAFGVVVANHPKKVVGFRRPAPQIVFKEERSCKIDKLNYSWSPEWNSKFVEVCSVDRIIIVHSEKNSGLINNMIDALKQMFKCRGIRCREFVDIFIRNSGISGREGQLENVFKENAGSQVTILIIYIDRVASNSHDFLKLMERKYLIPTQQITTEVAYKLPRQSKTCANFVSKTNLKLGGVNYEVIPEPFAKNRWIMDGKTLFVGYDVAHPGKPTRDEIVNKSPPQMPSVVGFSFNGAVHPGNFIGDYHFQSPRKEEVEALVLIARFKWILSTFVKNREVWPESVVITRDGISEGQYGMVIENELKAVRYACQDFAKSQGRESWTPFFTVIVVTKRHNSRFFVDNKRLENPKPATVVDTDVVRNDITEFYLQSHKAVQGTAKSTCYQILFDENNISMDEAQSLMLALTFNHQICDMPVSLPEPIYQADEWAKRGRNTWMAYCCRHNVIFQQEKGNYSKLPIDFEAMTKRLSFWNTKLQDRRLNA